MRRDEFPLVDKHVKNEVNAVLDKIRAEIEQKSNINNKYYYKQGLWDVLEIIDKYMEENSHEID